MEKKGKIFIESKNRFDEVGLSHDILKTINELGINVQDMEKFKNRLKHVNYGLSAEDECAAILAWLGNCKFVHKLDQDSYCSGDFGDIKIPDIFAVFSRGGEQFCTLIEVKCTSELYVSWNVEYKSKLAKYAKMLDLPILLAWRPRKLGQWLLLDAMSEKLIRDDRIYLEDAFPYNLMGIIAGDFVVVPLPSIGLHFNGKLVGEKTPTDDGFSTDVKITNAFFGRRNGNKLNKLNGSSLALLITTACKEYSEIKGNTISWGSVTPESPDEAINNSITAQNLLRTLICWAKKESECIAWRHVLKDLNSIMTKGQMEQELSQDIGNTVRYILHYQPKIIPSTLPLTWH